MKNVFQLDQHFYQFGNLLTKHYLIIYINLIDFHKVYIIKTIEEKAYINIIVALCTEFIVFILVKNKVKN